MSFVCEWCASGLSPDDIDAEATYPDDQLGGTDAETGGLLCEGCAESAYEDGTEVSSEGILKGD